MAKRNPTDEKPKKPKKPKKVDETPKKRQSIGDDWTFKEKVLEALKSSLGIISNACIKCNISRPTFYRWFHEDERFRAAVDDVIETQKDFVEGNLLKKIKDGDTSCIIFYCKTRLKERGYAERVEITGDNGGPIAAETNSTIKFKDVLSQMAGMPTQEDE